MSLPLTGAGPSANWITPADIPSAESVALKWLYDNTAGDAWTDNTNWGKTPVANDWFGVTVAAGRVQRISMANNNLIGDITAWDIEDFETMTMLNIVDNTGVTGTITTWVLPPLFWYFSIGSVDFDGDISGWVLPASLQYFYVYSTSLDGAPILTSAVNLSDLRYHNCSLPQAMVDAVLLAVAARFSAGGFTAATPAIVLGGTNTAPSGAYADEDPPTTGLGACFEICTDPEATGENTWTATVTGSGPYP